MTATQTNPAASRTQAFATVNCSGAPHPDSMANANAATARGLLCCGGTIAAS